MTYSKRSKFSWSFTGFPLEAEAQKSVDEMVAWFGETYDASEWKVVASVSQVRLSDTEVTFRASLVADRETSQE